MATALFQSGLLSARPAAGVRGRYYLATDEPAVFLDTGAAWLFISTDSLLSSRRSMALFGSLSAQNYGEILRTFDSRKIVAGKVHFETAPVGADATNHEIIRLSDGTSSMDFELNDDVKDFDITIPLTAVMSAGSGGVGRTTQWFWNPFIPDQDELVYGMWARIWQADGSGPTPVTFNFGLLDNDNNILRDVQFAAALGTSDPGSNVIGAKWATPYQLIGGTTYKLACYTPNSGHNFEILAGGENSVGWDLLQATGRGNNHQGSYAAVIAQGTAGAGDYAHLELRGSNAPLLVAQDLSVDVVVAGTGSATSPAANGYLQIIEQLSI